MVVFDGDAVVFRRDDTKRGRRVRSGISLLSCNARRFALCGRSNLFVVALYANYGVSDVAGFAIFSSASHSRKMGDYGRANLFVALRGSVDWRLRRILPEFLGVYTVDDGVIHGFAYVLLRSYGNRLFRQRTNGENGFKEILNAIWK